MPTSSTPALPQWILEAQVLGYSTAHRVLPDETRLYGTESLYGDWNGSVLLLAKDFAPSRILHERLAARHPRPYSHDPDLGTNKRLIRFAGHLARSNDPANCGMLYGSALANLLRDDGNFSGSLPNRPQAMKHGVDVLCFVVEHMPHDPVAGTGGGISNLLRRLARDLGRAASGSGSRAPSRVRRR